MQEVPITFYIRLDQGERADLEVVSRSALAFAAVVKELAYLLDPSASVRVEAINAEDRSFGLNTIAKIYFDVKTAVAAGAKKSPKIAMLAAYVALRIINNAVDWSQDQVMDWLSGNDAPPIVQTLTDAERRALADDIVEKLRKGAAQQEANRVFQAAAQDPKIDGIGVTSVPGKRPTVIVPRASFDAYSNGGSAETLPSDGERRVTQHHIEATLISPVLVSGDRRWKFKAPTGEFGAAMKDEPFVEEFLSGTANIRIKAGLVMDIELEVSEVRKDEAWVVEQRTVTKVYGWRDGPEQTDFLNPASQ